MLDSGLVLQIWGEAGPSGELRQLAAEAFATMGAAYGRYLTSWLVGQGHSTRAARTQARKLTPAFIGVAQGYLVHRAVLGRDAAAAYLDSIDHLVRRCCGKPVPDVAWPSETGTNSSRSQTNRPTRSAAAVSANTRRPSGAASIVSIE